uniref:Uncharacterized protein n=1 Tax=viral metagenome TaxID=1070528 RepID=A0A6C0BWD2_9ZZZZ
MDNMNNPNNAQTLIRYNKALLPEDVDKKNLIYLDSDHQLLKEDEIHIGKSYYAINIKNPDNVKDNQIITHDEKFYSSGPFQNFGKLKKISYSNYGDIYIFEYGKTEDLYTTNGSKDTHDYLYLDQDTINKPVEILPKNVLKINDNTIIDNPNPVIANRVAGKKRKTKKSRKPSFKKSRKSRRKTTRHKNKSRH